MQENSYDYLWEFIPSPKLENVSSRGPYAALRVLATQ